MRPAVHSPPGCLPLLLTGLALRACTGRVCQGGRGGALVTRDQLRVSADSEAGGGGQGVHGPLRERHGRQGDAGGVGENHRALLSSAVRETASRERPRSRSAGPDRPAGPGPALSSILLLSRDSYGRVLSSSYHVWTRNGPCERAAASSRVILRPDIIGTVKAGEWAFRGLLCRTRPSWWVRRGLKS